MLVMHESHEQNKERIAILIVCTCIKINGCFKVEKFTILINKINSKRFSMANVMFDFKQ
jgi:hypothetical protein